MLRYHNYSEKTLCLVPTFSMWDHHTCKYIQIYCTDVVFKWLDLSCLFRWDCYYKTRIVSELGDSQEMHNATHSFIGTLAVWIYTYTLPFLQWHPKRCTECLGAFESSWVYKVVVIWSPVTLSGCVSSVLRSSIYYYAVRTPCLHTF